MKTANQIVNKIENDGLAVLFRSLETDKNKFIIELNTPVNIDKYKIVKLFQKSTNFKFLEYATENLLDDSDLSQESGNLFITMHVKFPYCNFNTVKKRFTQEFDIEFEPTEEEYVGVSGNMHHVNKDDNKDNVSFFDNVKRYLINLLPCF